MKITAFGIISLSVLTFAPKVASAFCPVLHPHQTIIHLDENRTFSFKYEIVRKAQSGFPTVLFIPGGPGEWSMGNTADMSEQFPDQYGLILTDPRGAGCNASSQLRPDDFSTQNSARDLLSVLNQERLNPADVILYGFSYGTYLATVTAYLNQLANRQPFKALVLEGTIGHAYSGSLNNGFIEAADKYFAQRPGLASQVEAAIVAHGVDRILFARFFTSALHNGANGMKEHPLDRLLSEFINHYSQFAQEYLEPLKKITYNGNPDPQVWRSITCKELGSDDANFTFEKGELKAASEHSDDPLNCSGIELDNPYDSQAMQLREKLIYLQGSEDPATPLSQALYHMAHQKAASSKEMIIFEGYGHSVLNTLEEQHPGVSRILWRELFNPTAIKSQLPDVDFKVMN